jgi:hypothetical protein
MMFFLFAKEKVLKEKRAGFDVIKFSTKCFLLLGFWSKEIF